MNIKKIIVIFVIFFFVLLFTFLINIFNNESISDDNTKTTTTIDINNNNINDMKQININVIDNNGNPVSNLKVDILNTTGDSYYYTPDCFLTDTYGFTSCKVVPKSYKVMIKDSFNDVVYNEIAYEFVFDNKKFNYEFKWPYITPNERKINSGEFVEIYFIYDNQNVKNKSIKLFEGNVDIDDRWIVEGPKFYELGFTDLEGRVWLEKSSVGDFTVEIYIGEGGDEKKILKQIYIDGKNEKYYIKLN